MRNGYELNGMREDRWREMESGWRRSESGWDESGLQGQDLYQKERDREYILRWQQSKDEECWQRRRQETAERELNEWRGGAERRKIMLGRYNENMNLLPHIPMDIQQRTIEGMVEAVRDCIFFITGLIDDKERDLALAMEEVDRILSEIKAGHKEIQKNSLTDERTSELLVDINTNKRILEFLTKKSGLKEILELSIEDIRNILYNNSQLKALKRRIESIEEINKKINEYNQYSNKDELFRMIVGKRSHIDQESILQHIITNNKVCKGTLEDKIKELRDQSIKNVKSRYRALLSGDMANEEREALEREMKSAIKEYHDEVSNIIESDDHNCPAITAIYKMILLGDAERNLMKNTRIIQEMSSEFADRCAQLMKAAQQGMKWIVSGANRIEKKISITKKKISQMSPNKVGFKGNNQESRTSSDLTPHIVPVISVLSKVNKMIQQQKSYEGRQRGSEERQR